MSVPSGGTTAAVCYAYDAGDRSVTSLTYDVVGNRLSQSVSGASPSSTTYAYDAADELVSATPSTGAATTYAYDAAGERVRAGATTSMTTSSYDLAGDLTSTATGAVTTSYTYDPAGNRLSATVSGGAGAGTTTSVWDPNTAGQGLPDLVAETLPSGQVNTYDWLTSTLPVSQTRAGTTGGVSNTDYYLTDIQHSVTSMVSATGTVDATYAYDPFGNPTTATGSSAAGNPLRWTGAYLDPSTGQYDNRARTYDPTTGEFTSIDPLKALTGETYTYATNNPLSNWDPTGRATLGYCGGLAGSVLGPAGLAEGCLTRTVAEKSDQIGVVGSIGSGGAQSLSVFAGGYIQVSNATSLSQLKGAFTYFTLGRVSQRWSWFGLIVGRMSRSAVLSDEMWARLEPLLPSREGLRGRRFRDHRQVIEGIIFRQRVGCAWRDLPARFGPWQTVWKRHARFSRDGTWDRILTALLTEADARGELDWTVSVDSTVTRAHQHATNLPREVVVSEKSDTGGCIE